MAQFSTLVDILAYFCACELDDVLEIANLNDCLSIIETIFFHKLSKVTAIETRFKRLKFSFLKITILIRKMC